MGEITNTCCDIISYLRILATHLNAVSSFPGNGRFGKRQFAHLQLLAFIVERIQRILAFSCFALIEDINNLAVLVLSIGLAVDVIDIYFQGRSFLCHYWALGGQRKSQNKIEFDKEEVDIEVGLQPYDTMIQPH